MKKIDMPDFVQTGMSQIPQDKWFSWGWLIFWLIVFFPIAFVYLIIKMGNKK